MSLLFGLGSRVRVSSSLERLELLGQRVFIPDKEFKTLWSRKFGWSLFLFFFVAFNFTLYLNTHIPCYWVFFSIFAFHLKSSCTWRREKRKSSYRQIQFFLYDLFFRTLFFNLDLFFFCLFLEVLRVKYERDTYAGSLRFHIMSTISFLFNLKKRFHLIYNHFIFLSFLFLTLIFLITHKKKQRDNSFLKEKKRSLRKQNIKIFFFPSCDNDVCSWIVSLCW